jgi:hypothetical protein
VPAGREPALSGDRGEDAGGLVGVGAAERLAAEAFVPALGVGIRTVRYAPGPARATTRCAYHGNCAVTVTATTGDPATAISIVRTEMTPDQRVPAALAPAVAAGPGRGRTEPAATPNICLKSWAN